MKTKVEEISEVTHRLAQSNECERTAFLFFLMGWLQAEEVEISKHTLDGILKGASYLKPQSDFC